MLNYNCYNEDINLFTDYNNGDIVIEKSIKECKIAAIILLVSIDFASLNYKSKEKTFKKVADKLEIRYRKILPISPIIRCIDVPANSFRKTVGMVSDQIKEALGCLLIHYKAIGFSQPNPRDQKIRLFENSLSQYTSLHLSELYPLARRQVVFVPEIDKSEIFANSAQTQVHIFCFCGYDLVPSSSLIPVDLFASCLFSPVKTLIRWSLFKSKKHWGKSIKSWENIFKMTGLMKEFAAIFEAAAECIAWNTFPNAKFITLFKSHSLVSFLSRGFLLLQRVCDYKGVFPASQPKFPAAQRHQIWDALEYSVEQIMLQLDPRIGPSVIPSPSFFPNALISFENFLCHEYDKQKPLFLPVLLKMLRNPHNKGEKKRVLCLLSRFLAKGDWALNLVISLGFIDVLKKLMDEFPKEYRKDLILICNHLLLIGNDFTNHLIKSRFVNKLKHYINNSRSTDFVTYKDDTEQKVVSLKIISSLISHKKYSSNTKDMASFLSFKRFFFSENKLLKWWSALAISKVWQCFPSTRDLSFRRGVQKDFLSLFDEKSPEVRAAAVFSLGHLLTVSLLASREDFYSADFAICRKILSLSNDGSAMVRLQVVLAIFHFVSRCFAHFSSKQKLRKVLRQIKSSRSKKNIFVIVEKMTSDPLPMIANAAEALSTLIECDENLSYDGNKSLSNFKTVHVEEIVDLPKESKKFDFYGWSSSVFSNALLSSRIENKIGHLPTQKIFSHSKNHVLADRNFDIHCEALRHSSALNVRSLAFEKIAKGAQNAKALFKERPEIMGRMNHRVRHCCCEAELRKVLFDPKDSVLVGIDCDDVIRVWNYKADQKFAIKNSAGILKRKSDFDFLNIFPKMLMTSANDGIAKVWRDYNTKDFKLCASFVAIEGMPRSQTDSAAVRCTKSARSGDPIFAGSNGHIRLWDATSETVAAALNLSSGQFATSLFTTKFEPDLLFFGTSDGRLKAIDWRIKDASVFEQKIFSERVIKVHLKTNKILVAGYHSSVKISDIRYSFNSYYSKPPLLDKKSRIPLKWVSVHDIADVFAYPSSKDSLKMYRFDGKEISTIRQLDSISGSRSTNITCMAFQPHQPMLAVSGRQSRLSIYSTYDKARSIQRSISVNK